LRIYFGAASCVGKTYAMLMAARALHARGVGVLIGVVDAHACHKTAALCDGLPRLALTPVDGEFDLDAALQYKPTLVVVDELAHTNGPGARHRKRWRDVDELLHAGIDVFTTVRVQDLESLNDVVGGITGTRVAETLPDSVFDAAGEVVLVDVPLDELLARLSDLANLPAPRQALASPGFARKGNLIALRELALRRMAERVEDDVQAHRIEQSIGPVWKTDTALLACVGPMAGAEHVVRSAARLAGQLNASWHAIYIETPQLRRLASARSERVLKTLKLAESLGATTAVLTGNDISQTIVDYARSHNFSKIVLGHSHRSWADAFPWHKERLKRIAATAPDIDLIEIGRWSNSQELATHSGVDSTPVQAGATLANVARTGWRKRYLWATGASLATALAAALLLPYLEVGNVAMLFLLTVVLVSVRLGQGASVVATVVGAVALVLLTTKWRFAMGDLQHVVTFLVMLVVGLITGKLTSDLRYQSGVATDQAARARALYEFSRALSGALQTEQIFEITRTFVQRTFSAKATLLLPNGAGSLQMPAVTHGDDHRAPSISTRDLGTAQGAFDRATPAGASTDTEPDSQFFYLPLVAPMRTRGVLAIELGDQHWVMVPEQRKQLDTFAALAAIALERVHYVEVAQDALVDMESERLRNSLLAAISHDLRTPLTSLVGLSESLALSSPHLNVLQLELADALRNEALRMSDLVTNLLDMARMQSGHVQLDMQWQSLEEVVGSALRARASLLAQHQLVTALAPTLPLVCFDAVLIERVLCNLVENAAKYTPAGSCITLAAEVHTNVVQMSVSDNGPGVPSGREEAIFEKFTRGERESAKPGVGLGLSICRAIVQAHGGKIGVRPGPAGGAAFVFTLPLGVPPAMPFLDDAE
jgi:two-component system sensor histidine kinase KdpD